jgi:ABC-2 type transport system permease protein
MTGIRKLLATYFKVNLQQDFAYRTELFVNIFTGLVWTGWELASLGILVQNAQELNGWRLGDLLVLMGLFKFAQMLMHAVAWTNTELFNRGMREGTLDYAFLAPINSQLLMSIQRVQIWSIGFNLLLAGAFIIGGISQMGGTLTVANLLAFALLACSGLLILYSVWIFLMALTFWFTRFDNNVTLMQALMDTGRYPSTVYPGWLRVLVTFVIPIAVATTVPVQALRGELALWQVAGFVAIALVVFWGVSRFWKAGTKRYSGASA